MSKNQALVICISGPSGVGKDTVITRLRRLNPDMWLSVSATSRKPREREVDQKDYFFLTEEEFQRRIEAGEILEYDRFCGAYYGTPRTAVEEKLAEGRDIIMDITVKGALAIKEALPEAVTIFLLPPDLYTLRTRLSARGTETEEAIEARLAEAQSEIDQATKFDHTVTNRDLDQCVAEIKEIIRQEKSRRIADVN
jgi:guanylate kinase